MGRKEHFGDTGKLEWESKVLINAEVHGRVFLSKRVFRKNLQINKARKGEKKW